MSRSDGTAALGTSRFRLRDVLSVGSSGLRTRKLRTALSALGVTIGIGAMVGVLGLSASSRAGLNAEIEALGTNLLTVEAGTGLGAGDQLLPEESPAKVTRIGPVEQVTATVPVDASVLRNDFVNPAETGGITVVGADANLLDTLNGEIAIGTFLDAATVGYPIVVLGSVAAERLGIESISEGVQVLIGEERFTVMGVLVPFPLAPDLDRAAMIGQEIATDAFDGDVNPGTIYLRTNGASLDEVRGVLPATIDPENPEEVTVSRPSDILEAQVAAESAFTSLFLGLGAVALLVGGIGIANVMVIAVIERRSEIGLRRALGGTRAHIGWQFLTEALVLSALGGLAGVVLGALLTAGYATSQGWQIVLPLAAAVGGFAAALLIGAVAGLYPAVRAARLAPTEALRAT